MNMRHQAAFIATTVILVASIFTVALLQAHPDSKAFAASKPSQNEQAFDVAPHFKIVGNLRKIGSPADYPDMIGASKRDLAYAPLQLANVSYFVSTAHLVNGRFEYTERLSSDSSLIGYASIRAQAIVVNPGKHTELIAVGTPTEPASPPPSPQNQDAKASTSNRGSALTPSDIGSFVEYHGWYTDIVNITLGGVRDDVDWNWNGTYVTSCAAWYNTEMDTFSGWGISYQADSTNCGDPISTSYGTEQSWESFTNSHFCRDHGLGNYTSDIYISNSWAAGYYNGSWNGTSSHSYDGACLPFYWNAQLTHG